MTRRRVGFYGGSFDPPHLQHQATALYAMEAANINELVVAPIYIHPDGKQMAPFLDRVRMVKELMDPLRALRPIRVSMIEEQVAHAHPERPPGRTADTIEFIRQMYTPSSAPIDYPHPPVIVLVLGSDIKAAFPTWAGHERLEMMTSEGDLEVFWVDRAVDLSSTQVRARVKAGLSTDRMIAARTRRLIDQKGLYR